MKHGNVVAIPGLLAACLAAVLVIGCDSATGGRAVSDTEAAGNVEAAPEASATVELSSVSSELLAGKGIRFDMPSAAEAASVVVDQADVEAMASEEHGGQLDIIETVLVKWEDLSGEGWIADDSLVWVVVGDPGPGGFYVHGGAAEPDEMVNFDVYDAETGTFIGIFQFDRCFGDC